MESKLTGVAQCGLHKRTPYGITDVGMGYFSVARFSGSCKFNGDTYIYFPDTDELVREDVLEWKNKLTKAKH